MENDARIGDVYLVTGVNRIGERIAPVITSYLGFALAINVYRGSIWRIRDGELALLKRYAKQTASS